MKSICCFSSIVRVPNHSILSVISTNVFSLEIIANLLYPITSLFSEHRFSRGKFSKAAERRDRHGVARQRIAQGERPQGANPGYAAVVVFAPREGRHIVHPIHCRINSCALPGRDGFGGFTYPWFAPCGREPGAILCLAPLGRSRRSAAFENGRAFSLE